MPASRPRRFVLVDPCLTGFGSHPYHYAALVLDAAAGLRKDIAVFGEDYPTPDGTCVRDYIHVEDLADAHLRALAKLQGGASAIKVNLGTGQGFSVRQVIEAARKVTGLPIPVRMAPRREGDPAQVMAGGTRARDVLGWVPARPGLEDIVGDAWRFHCRRRGQ